ncbi:hypothetical protein K504DRAFT_489903 [Pleomassaria siparia CBS 279.74]|uniref:ER membrane protein complex subunit 7 beta-sandwich domain-containing protein n=1 Tax=Pleomassaria siparia CBS 279.74 TaxID=1314801 RepID=A0A6G1KDH4_9PLEO|nr:hypothetical protein K504DRAFT_489903 [Pleomassaria siparia CBS 279.74]
MRTSLATLACLASAVSAARFTLHIPNTPIVNPSTLPSTTYATLHSSGAPIEAYLTRANSFNFANVSAGSYLLMVHCRDYAFHPLRLDVSVEEAVEGSGEKRELVKAWQTFIGNEWDNKGELIGEGGNGVVLETRPLGQKYYFQERQGFSPLSFLKSPMILMALFSMVMIFGMPYLMENMDPETRAEFEEMQKKSPLAPSGENPAQKLQNFDLAGWMAGKTDSGSNSRGASPAPGSKKRG